MGFNCLQEFPVDSESTSFLETTPLFKWHHQRSKSESPNFKLDMSSGSVKNLAVDQLRQELSSLKSLVSKLEHVRSNDGEQSQESSVSDKKKMEVAEDSKPCTSIFR